MSLSIFLIGVSVGWILSYAGPPLTTTTRQVTLSVVTTLTTTERETILTTMSAVTTTIEQTGGEALRDAYEESGEGGLRWRFLVYEFNNASGFYVRFEILVPIYEPELTLRKSYNYRFIITFGNQTMDDWIATGLPPAEARHTVGPFSLDQLGRELPLPVILNVLGQECSKYGCKPWRTDATVTIFHVFYDQVFYDQLK